MEVSKMLLDLLDYEEFSNIDPECSYFKRFPTCQHVKRQHYSDGSVGTHCFRGAFGLANGEAMSVPWECCQTCDDYLKK